MIEEYTSTVIQSVLPACVHF